jgi:hypothetical protein
LACRSYHLANSISLKPFVRALPQANAALRVASRPKAYSHKVARQYNIVCPELEMYKLQ